MDNIIRRSELARRLSISTTTLWRWVRTGRLPAPICLGPNTVGWREAEIEAWLEQRALEARQ